MTKSHLKLSKTLASLAFDSPQVIAARLHQFSLPGAMHSARDQSEFARMHLEKQAASIESFTALWLSAATSYQRLWLSLVFGQTPAWPSGAALARSAQAVLRPYQRRASANARRLAKR